MKTSGRTMTNTRARIRNSWTKATITACRLTIPDSTRYAAFVAVEKSSPRDMNPVRICSSNILVRASNALTCAPRMLYCVWVLRLSIVAILAIPTLPPRFRIKLKMLVAFPSSCLGIRLIVTVVSGTKMKPIEMPWKNCGQKISQ